MQHHSRPRTAPAPPPPATAAEIAALARLLVRRPELNHLDDDKLLLRLARTTAVGHLLRSRVATAAPDAERLLDAMLVDGRAVVLDVTDPAPGEGVLAVRRPAAARDLPRARDMARALAPLLAGR
ncbi:hypothetical protein FHR75_001825 [Kineococcus radiotolerans]|uniref:Uncharacterized protein n=1 Tax=Kineococcus radiotolerans TaxID=131568 RepID=A0A7W4XX18_KINRA|nr:hypothetical protein [Kineococcus radiotolerans]MBB2901037.1 hypothetical protein [Kineococcus radiotolerans]